MPRRPRDEDPEYASQQTPAGSGLGPRPQGFEGRHNLDDPRTSNHWSGPGAIGRWWPGGGAQSELHLPRPPQAPLPAPPLLSGPQDAGYDFGFQDTLLNPMDPMADWDYQNMPLSPEGIPMSPRGELLSDFPRAFELWQRGEGAGFDPFGNPHYGEGLGAWWDGVADRFSRLRDTGDFQPGRPDAEPFMQQVLDIFRAPKEEVLPRLGQLGSDVLSWPGSLLDEATQAQDARGNYIISDALKATGFTVSESLRAIMEVAQIPAEVTEQAVGTIEGTLTDLGADSGLSDYRAFAQQPRSDAPDWQKWLINAAQTPSRIAWNAVRTLVSPGESWDEIGDAVSNNLQAARIQYSNFIDPALRQHYIERMENGEDPQLLQMEMGIPGAEMVGQIILDPLNLLGLGLRRVRDVQRVNKYLDTKEFFTRVDPTIRAALAADKGSEAQQLQRFTDVVEALKRVNRRVAQNTTDLAKQTGLRALTTAGKRFWVNRRVGEITDWITNTVRFSGKGVDEVYEMMRGLVLSASDNSDEIAQGYTIISKLPGHEVLLSDAGRQAGVVLRTMLTDDNGILDASKFLDGLKAAQKSDEPLEAVAKYIDSKVTKAVDAQFPTMTERLDAARALQTGGSVVLDEGQEIADVIRAAKWGTEINPVEGFLARFDQLAKSKLYQPVNRYLSGLYMGLSPGYAARNMITNTVHIFMDLGPGAWGKVAPFNIKEYVPIVQGWLGGLPRGMIEGLGVHSTEFTRAGKWYEKFLEVGERMERAAAYRVVGHTVEKIMTDMIRPGKALPDFTPLVNAGWDAQTVNGLTNLVLKHKGDVRKAIAEFKSLARTGDVDTTKMMLFLVDQDTNVMRKFPGFRERLQEAVGLDNADDAARHLQGYVDEFAEEAKNVSREPSGFTEESGMYDELATVDGVNNPHITDETMAVVQTRYEANEQAFNAYKQLRMEVTPSALQVDEVTKSKILKEVRTIDQLLAGAYGKVKSESEAFTKWVWTKTKQLRATSKNTDWAAEWRKLMGGVHGFVDDPPPGVTKQELLDYLWDTHFRTVQKDRWAAAREYYIRTSEDYYRYIKELVPGMDPQGQQLARARFAADQARQFDDAAFLGGAPYRLAELVASDLSKGRRANALRGLAHNYGISSISDTGAFTDKRVLDTINLYAKTTFKSLDEVPIEVAHQAFEARHLAKGRGPKIADLDQWLGRTPRQVDNPAAGAAAVVDEPPVGEPTALVPAANLDHAPSGPRMAHENLQGLRAYTDDLVGRMRSSWGDTAPAPLGAEQAKALEDWAQVAEGRMAELRYAAAQAGNEARKFTLHNYAEKRNIDLVLSYIYPYHFWYSRTYANWLKRLVTNLDHVAHYGKYKDAMAEIHAGLPDWWKNNINSNELLGLDWENPLFFNLEATLNPLNGLTGIDFNDPNRRVGAWTNTLDDLGKFGPSIWTPFSVATAIALSIEGEEDAAARWAGRMIPQTAALRSAGALLNLNIEADPFVHIFSGGMDPYERRRVGRALGTLTEEGVITAEQGIDAAHTQEGEIWEMATMRALDQRAVGQLMGTFFGVGFKARNPTDIQIDQFYQQYYMLWNLEPELSPDEFRQGMEQLRVAHPFMDAVLLARKGGPDRDRALAYNVLSRIPPGQKSDLTELIGIDERLLDEFYANKGNLGLMTETERNRFMAAVIDLSAILALPEDATRAEWNTVKMLYNQFEDQSVKQWGVSIQDKVDMYFAVPGEGDARREMQDLILEAHPEVADYLDWRAEVILADPLLSAYYGSLDMIQNYYKGERARIAERIFGKDIFDLQKQYFEEVKVQQTDLWNQYYLLRDTSTPENAKAFYDAYLKDEVRPTNAFLKQHPQIERYWEWKRTYDPIMEARIESVAGALREGIPVTFREDIEDPSLFQEEFLGQYGQLPALDWEQWQDVLTPEQVRLTLDFLQRGEIIPEVVEDRIVRTGTALGIPESQVLNQIIMSYQQAQAGVPLP